MAGTGPALGFRSVLRNRPYLLWLASSDAATVGYSVYSISIVWLAFVATHNYAVVGLVLFVEYATYAAASLVAPFADRVRNQRTIYLACYPVQAVAAAVLGWGAYDGFLTVPLLLGLILVISAFWDLAWAAFQAAPRLLLTREELFAASGFSGAIGGANSIAGYAAGGVLIVVVGAAGGMFLYAALLGVGALLALPLSIRPGPSRDIGYRESLRSGWRYLSSRPGRPLLHLAFVDALRAFFTAGVALLITLVSVTSFAHASTAYSVLFSTYVIGGVVAGLGLGWLNPRGRAGLVIVGSLVVCGLGFVAAGLVPPVLALAVMAWLLVGFGLSGFFTAKEALVAGSVDPDKLARVSANMYLFPGITSAVGALVLGALASNAAPLAFGLILGAGFLVAALFALRWPGTHALRY